MEYTLGIKTIIQTLHVKFNFHFMKTRFKSSSYKIQAMLHTNIRLFKVSVCHCGLSITQR